MIELTEKNNEVSITVKFNYPLGSKPRIELYGEGDLSHHLIEGVFGIIDKLARMENVGHQSKEWTGK